RIGHRLEGTIRADRRARPVRRTAPAQRPARDRRARARADASRSRMVAAGHDVDGALRTFDGERPPSIPLSRARGARARQCPAPAVPDGRVANTSPGPTPPLLARGRATVAGRA